MDLISRQAAIDALSCCQTYLYDSRDKYPKIELEDAKAEIESLPTAEPEIIRCKDCYHYPSEYSDCPMIGWFRHEDDYCSRAERRNDG